MGGWWPTSGCARATPAQSNNILSFIESALENLGTTKVGLFRADSGFYDKTIVSLLTTKGISHIISARLTQALQQAIVENCKWQQVAPGLEVVGELNGRAATRSGTPPVGTESRSMMRVGGRLTRGAVRLDAGILLGLTSRDPGFGFTAGATYVFKGFTIP